ncbi:hypothetical protein [Pseudomonas asiatica]|uniref:hypothetical protein n=1 Tax=Pseudomonas asiatica TaxID=2219225 RepID=UPI001F3167E0|nr:hypothetical protein [Pseudomonas asiatica]
MRNLPVPVLNDRVIFSGVAKSKIYTYKARLYKVRSDVNARYKEYMACEPKLEALPRSKINVFCADALVKCYSSKTKALDSLRDELLYPDLDDFDECPLCGIGEPITLDHYLPKEEFPEFSIFSKNLIPVCSPCNSSYKGVKWIENGKRLFIHTYFDIFPPQAFLNASVTVGAKLSLSFNALNDPAHTDFSELFSRHFEKLKLSDRYKRKAASEIARKKRRFEAIFRRSGSARDVANALLQEAIDLRNEYSSNHWKPALYEALSKSPDFCNGGFRKPIGK